MIPKTEAFGAVNYGDLARALSALGFKEHTGKTDLGIPYRAFYHKACDAFIGLPDMSNGESLEPVHLRVAEKTVEGRGVADVETFHRLLREAAQKEAQAA